MPPRPRIVRTRSRQENKEDVAPDATIKTETGETEAPIDPDFDEATYLRAYPDIADAVRRGVVASGLEHFRRTGRAEARLEKSSYRALFEARAEPAPPRVLVDALTVSPTGAALIIGWSDDRLDPLTRVELPAHADGRRHWADFPRLVRSDVERTLEAAPGHRFGFLLVAASVDGGAPSHTASPAANAPSFHFASGAVSQPRRREPVFASDAELRDLALAALPPAVAAEPDPAAVDRILDQHVGVQIAAMSRLAAERARSTQLIERFGPPRRRYLGSIITTLRGGADQIVPRLALTATGPNAGEYEFIVVVPVSEQFEAAARAAAVAETTLGVSLTLVLRHGGDPSCMGGDAALDAAQSDRLIFMDQAVLPRERDWAARHAAVLDGALTERTRLFGGLLHRPDGGLANGGYYFEQKTSFPARSLDPPRRVRSVILRSVTDPAPSAAPGPPVSRPVIGVPAAFLSVDRGWFEALGGCTGEYSAAAHEDIDLCLRSLRRDVPAWVHPLPMWHLQCLPPLRREPSKGGAIFNRWRLHRQWDEMIVPDLLGRDPKLPGFAQESA